MGGTFTKGNIRKYLEKFAIFLILLSLLVLSYLFSYRSQSFIFIIVYAGLSLIITLLQGLLEKKKASQLRYWTLFSSGIILPILTLLYLLIIINSATLHLSIFCEDTNTYKNDVEIFFDHEKVDFTSTGDGVLILSDLAIEPKKYTIEVKDKKTGGYLSKGYNINIDWKDIYSGRIHQEIKLRCDYETIKHISRDESTLKLWGMLNLQQDYKVTDNFYISLYELFGNTENEIKTVRPTALNHNKLTYEFEINKDSIINKHFKIRVSKNKVPIGESKEFSFNDPSILYNPEYKQLEIDVYLSE
jgi:hypothetical protein